MEKKNKNNRVDRNGVKKSMTFWDYIGDGCGQGGLNLIMSLSGQVSYFYTEKVGVAAATVSIVLIIAKIIDAFTDLPMGRIIDKSRNPKGKCRPWFLRMALPFLISIVLLFTVPKGVGAAVQLAYLLLTNILLTALVYTAVSVPYSVLPVLRTKSSEERSMIQVSRSIFSYLFGAIISLSVIPVTNMLGGTQLAWIKYGAVVGIAGALMLLFCYKTSKETPAEELGEEPAAQEEEDVPFAQGVRMLVKNKYWIFAMVTSLVYQVGFGIAGASGTYYAKYIYGNDNLVAIGGAIGMIGMLLGFVMAGPIIKKFGLVGSIRVLTVFDVTKMVVMAFFPRAFWVNSVLASLGSIFSIAGVAACNVMVNNCVEYNEYLYGVKLAGMTNSVVGFSGKVGSGIGAALVTFCLSVSGFISGAAAQPESVTYGIYAFAIYIPLAIVIIKFIFSELYRPYEKIYTDIVTGKLKKAQK
ncbi:MAG: glycoside-pentoside-hexuronide (GPH):cation symporter [Lachnospiraceae bacterium]|nr:glycoside-pentoside-hexuronide (GPH):cation symporter [Lachnospiraceae bacterium]